MNWRKSDRLDGLTGIRKKGMVGQFHYNGDSISWYVMTDEQYERWCNHMSYSHLAKGEVNTPQEAIDKIEGFLDEVIS